MPITKRWSPFTLEKLKKVPKIQGIYELGNVHGEILYIGSGDSRHGVRSRLAYHKKHKPKSVRYFRFLEAGFFESPLALEEEHCQLYFDRHGCLPPLQKRMPKGYILGW